MYHRGGAEDAPVEYSAASLRHRQDAGEHTAARSQQAQLPHLEVPTMAHIVNTSEELSGEAAERLLREVCTHAGSIHT